MGLLNKITYAYLFIKDTLIVKILSPLKVFLGIAILFYSTSGHSQNHQHRIDSIQASILSYGNDTIKVDALNSLSKCYWEIDEYDKALQFAGISERLAKYIKDGQGLASATRKQAGVYQAIGNYPMALELFLRSLKISDSIGDKHGSFLSLNNIGLNYCSQKDYDKGLEYFWKAYEYDMERDFVYDNIGQAYLGKDNYSMALQYFMKALKISESNLDKSGIANSCNNLGSCYEELKNYNIAISWYKQSLKIWEELGYEGNICYVLGGIGDVYLKQNNYTQALHYQIRSLDLAKKTHALGTIQYTEKSISEIYEKLGDSNKALKHHKQYLIMKDSIFNEENTKKSVRSEMNFEFDKQKAIARSEQDKKDAIKNAEIKTQKIMRNIFIIGSILLVVFLGYVYRNYKNGQIKNNIIERQKHLVEEKSKEITDNINYASRIQKAMLTSDEYLKNNLPENFIWFSPKDIVSGDWYWAYRKNNDVFFAACDCTGHGTSGAMLSMISMSLLNEIVIERGITSPNEVLNNLRTNIIRSLNQAGSLEERKDGLDLSFCKLSLDTLYLEIACANNPAFIVRQQEIIEIKANRFPVGKYAGEEKPFTLNTLQLQKGDIIYSLTDGAEDQFGGPKDKKLTSKRLKEWLKETSTLNSMSDIYKELNTRFLNWIGNAEQTDDVTVFGIRV